MFEVLSNWVTRLGMGQQSVQGVATVLAVAILVVLVLATAMLAKRGLAPLIEKMVRRTSCAWDDALAVHHFFTRLSGVLPVLVLYLGADLGLLPAGVVAQLISRIATALFVVVGIWTLDALLSGFQVIYNSHEAVKDRPIRGYVQAAKIIVFLFGGVFVVAILMNKSPWGLLSVLGGLTAILILVFKDTILGFVAGVQLSVYDMVRVGDWIEMPKFGADGDVIDVSINTVKVRNWDKTITTVPTYALVSDTFKNWRGMQESGGRRIKRSVFIDMSSIRFCDADMLARYRKIGLLRDYLNRKTAEIEAFNREHQVNTTLMINGRQQTNIGVFRAYVVAYLRNHPQIHQNMTFLVRHLEPTPQGLPLEIYVFSKDQAWANYEAIQADIFDHILAAVPQFDLRIFQYPTGYDLRQMNMVHAG